MMRGDGPYPSHDAYELLHDIAGYSPRLAAHVASGNSNLGLTTLDLDLGWDTLPNSELLGHRFVPYSVIGVGYAWASLGGLQLQAGERVYLERLAQFGDSGGVIDAQADGETSFVLGSARRATAVSRQETL